MQPSLLLGRDTHRELTELLKKERRLVISGASNETAKALLLSLLLEQNSQRTLLVTGREEEAEALQHWLQFFGQTTHILHPIENEEGEVLPDALQTFLQFTQGEESKNGIFLCSRETWDQSFPRFAELLDRMLTLTLGKEINFTKFVEDLIERGYQHGEDLYLSPGEYRRIGDVFDIFPIQSSHPYRVSFDMDRVEKILTVDPIDLSKTEDGGKEMQIFPLLYEETDLLVRQIPAKALLVIDDQDDVEFPMTATALRFTPFPETDDHHAHLRYLSVLKFYTLIDFLNDVKDKLTQKWAIFVVTKRIEELKGICKEEHVSCSTDLERTPGTLTLIGAGEDELLPHSLQNPDLKFALLTDREIFSLRKAGKQRSIQKLALDFITSLVPGDYVVHMEHGIGHFEGMTQKEVDGTLREYLELTYAEGDKLFVPVDQADKLSKFVYEEGQEPILTRLGTNEWKRVMKKTKEETELIAKELLLLYAKRAKAKGYGFGEDTDIQRKFEESFPYEETPGQRKAIEDLKTDMESGHPMDRLICGDVGFGKTEVAMRAAFKAVQSGKQVAVVAPITILADQHYHNFRERMAPFNVRIEMLSRFRSAKEQRETLERLKKGEVDLVIGTHRLLQEDVHFHNLGLVIVDEEQRFGVKQKEKFKEMRASVDILTLTATPIPRTLNLGLHKLRDITTITTPPPGRLPIITEVRRYSDSLIRHAIIFELKRKGQAFILHNRVETIDAFADKLRMLIPEAKFIVAHGQLKADELEERVLEFKKGNVDVLVSSTIIENGIDLPRANTLVVDEAEHFGLAQLYQLRGRVGRSKVQAYAYFLYHGQKLQDDAKKRLRAIVEACELGSGFQVAMRDLEIRGAGEILGASQSGTMNTVGVSHYLRMLKGAVEEMKAGEKGEVEEEISAEILLPVEAMLPSFYVTDEQERISVYQKLAGSEDASILKEFEEDLRDEFGEPPTPVKNLFAILRLKLACRHAGVIRIKMEHEAREDFIVLTLAGRVTAKEIMQLLKENPQWKISGSNLHLPFAELTRRAGAEESQWLLELTKEVEMLGGKSKEKK
ncbi:MAG TPA: transcription-repair coupling factor [Candidatus Peribacter riflensis]|uniref:Transcription-repair-coupling factor n=1 Tax=Candidatus Peribacter riflensis TaxID=1735162 RepID=A0A0S1SRP5_9BACT|nr:MAG: transcription-repair coupling factor (superfamily II helicase) [Candidatus Peribacter riflensis]OGJ78440.1 MAG: transcription-repair coupling factor [Candidatus Peribacteria bacterium RIFOXYB1_FULL_57_12]OGJ83164.1 MAG: transcription-repair coupling factor [Candidatus Peribacteria bacterium RIFOXYC1_FULL_58_8]ALM11477.1 MAG: transcription-repair coupling factor [Candidatus Peribacter riflensis]ALM12579.1 MAG: transcription-repair coupling factor (superfamily II helicase) [Candidatus Per